MKITEQIKKAIGQASSKMGNETRLAEKSGKRSR